MSYTLINHPQGYNFQKDRIPYSLLTLTAFDYGQRHRELAQTEPHAWLGHTVLFIAECIPVIGIIVAAIEYLAASFFLHMLPADKASSLANRMTVLPRAAPPIKPILHPETAFTPSFQVIKEDIVSTGSIINDKISTEFPFPYLEPIMSEDMEDDEVPVVFDPIGPMMSEDISAELNLEPTRLIFPQPKPGAVNPKNTLIEESMPPLPTDFKDTAELLREAENYLNNADHPAPLTFPTINVYILEQKELIQALLKKHDGLCIGEYHNDSSPKYFLTVNMPLFKSLSVTTLYLEGYTGQQEELDNYFAGHSIEIPESFKQKIQTFAAPYAPGYYCEFDVLMAAKQAGIRMVSIDSAAAWGAEIGGTLRAAAMNYQAKLIIDKDRAQYPGGKSIIYAGAAHTNRIAGVPSLGQMYQFPSLLIRDHSNCSVGVDAVTIPPYSIDKEITDNSSTRVENIDFLIEMDKPLKLIKT